MEQFLAVLNEVGAMALAEPLKAALFGGGTVLVLMLLMLLGHSGGLRRLRKVLEAERKNFAKLTAAVDGGQQKLEELQNALSQHQERVAQLEQDKHSQARRIDELSEKLSAQQNLYSQLEQSLGNATASLDEQSSRLDNQLTQCQLQINASLQANEVRIADLGQQIALIKQGQAALQEQLRSLPSQRASATVAPELEAQLKQSNAQVESLRAQLAGVESQVSQLNANVGGGVEADVSAPPAAVAAEPAAPEIVETPAAAPVPSQAAPEAEPAKAAAKKGMFGLFGKKAAAPEAPAVSQEKPAAPPAAPVPQAMPEPVVKAEAEPAPAKSDAKKGVFGLFGKKPAAPEEAQASQEKPAVPQAAPAPAAEVPAAPEPAKPEAKGLFDMFGKKAPAESPAAPAPAPQAAPAPAEAKDEAAKKDLSSLMAEDLKKGKEQLKGLFRFGGKK
ncbi:hypothetical protein [Methylogaea oryzae]|uniref:Uncharacterized protein n=2 Tax=Methylogaea oryzae TaxID=1295382 RepID=A0A8D4VTT0_9GAMM|nr:hypothetical protein [Methylogaea oryzae]BBL72492.1 hypothetical protein MoryE10_30980 [Methylogaea oryzae]